MNYHPPGSASRLPSHPAYCEIDLGAIRNNVRELMALVGHGTAVMAVVKANGYGHGAAEVARAAAEAGATWLGVSSPIEGIALRHAGAAARTLVLGCTPARLAHEAVAHHLALTVYDLRLAAHYAAMASSLGRVAWVHVKVDTGMSRLGVRPDEAVEFVRALHAIKGLVVEGLFTHFSTADSADPAYTLGQLAMFNSVLGALDAAGLRPPLVHAANSAGTLAFPAARFNLVRTGIALYGLDPSADVRCPPGFEPALAWKTTVTQVKTLAAGQPVSYGNTYVTSGVEQIAVIAVGYADGFRRGAPNEVLIGGRLVPVVGQVCMDQSMVNVRGLDNVGIGDEVVLIGRQGQQAITADAVARRWDTINYDVICGIGARVGRVYL
jgi:alanine racemase